MPVRRMIGVPGKSSLISGRMSPFCHWALEEAIIVGSPSALATRPRPTMLLFSSAALEVSRVLASRPTW